MASSSIWLTILEDKANEDECSLQPLPAICAYLSRQSHTRTAEDYNCLLEECLKFIELAFARHHHQISPISSNSLCLAQTSKIHIVGDDFIKTSLRLLCDLIKISENEYVTEQTAAAIGMFIAKSGGTFAKTIEELVTWALHTLEVPESRTHEELNAIILLRCLAEQAPAPFNVHVQEFLNIIWRGLNHPAKNLRIASAKAVGACLCIIEQRKTRKRVIWLNQLSNTALRGLRSASHLANTVHGCLMVISELLQFSGEFMLARYEEVVKQILGADGPKAVLVRISILELIPLLADFCPERFFEDHLRSALEMILTSSRKDMSYTVEEEIVSLETLKRLAYSVKEVNQPERFTNWILDINQKLLDAFEKKETQLPALECCGMLAHCLEAQWKPHAEKLLPLMIQTGISHSLANCLQMTLKNVPELTDEIHRSLLDLIYLLLIDKPFSEEPVDYLKDKVEEMRNPQTMITALDVLCSFDFVGRDFLNFADEHICTILAEYESCQVRSAAARAVVSITKSHIHSDLDSVMSILERLVTCGIADGKEGVRYTIWDALLNCPSLDQPLLGSGAADLLIIPLGDVCLSVQFASLKLISRLIQNGGSSLESAIASRMFQLVSTMDSSLNKERNQICTELLGQLIVSCPSVMIPHANKICNALIFLLEKQKQPVRPAGATAAEDKFSASSTGLVAAALQTVGHLADHAGSYIDENSLETLTMLTMAALQKPEVETASIEAVRTLGKIASCTGEVTKPYHEHASLLPRLLEMIQFDDPDIRVAVTRTLGILSAIDPAAQRRIQAQASGEGRLELEGVRPIKKVPTEDDPSINHGLGVAADKGAMDLLMSGKLVIDTEESYSLFAINALLKVLKQHSLSAFHKDAIRVLGSITSSLSFSSVQYLNILVPNWCDAVYVGDEGIKHLVLEQFVRLVTIVKQHIRYYLKHMMKLIENLWTDECSQRMLLNLLRLLKEIAAICRHDLEAYMHWIVPKLILLMETGSWDLLPLAMDAISAFGPSLKDHFHQLIPSMARLMMSRCMKGRENLQVSILRSIEKIAPTISVPELAASLFVPLLNVLRDCDIDKEIIANTVATVAFAARLDDQAFQRVKSALLNKSIRSSKLNILTSNVHSSNREVDLIGSWRSKFESPVLTNPDVVEENAGRQSEFSATDLRRVWNAEQRYTYQDWLDWMRLFSLELLRTSPSLSLHQCHELAQNIPSMAKDLFSASFVSCWSKLSQPVQEEFIRHLEAAMARSTIPPEILTTLLNLAEFMERNGYKVLLDKRTLAALSMKCQAFAKALHYKEIEFLEKPESAIEHMLAIYNQCFLPAAADGLLVYAKKNLNMEMTHSWYEKLNKWDKALEMYNAEYREPMMEIEKSIEINLGRMRCYSALWDWENLNDLCRKQWNMADPTVRKQIAPLAAQAAWKMEEWDEMSKYLKAVDVEEDHTSDAATCSFLCGVNKIHLKEFDSAQEMIDKTRQFLSADLAALAGESYERAYEKMVRVQQLAELEEVMQVMQSEEKGDNGKRSHIVNIWKTRLSSVRRRADVWESCLSVRSLVLKPQEDILTWMKFASMCRRQDKPQFAKSLLLELLGYDPMEYKRGQPGYGSGSDNPEVMFAFLKHMFGINESSMETRLEIIERLMDMIDSGELEVRSEGKTEASEVAVPAVPLIARAYLKLAKWNHATSSAQNSSLEQIDRTIYCSLKARDYAENWAKAWRQWAFYNLKALSDQFEYGDPRKAAIYVAPAVKGFFKALKLSQESALRGGMLGSGPSKDTYQDILRLLTLWFNHGNVTEQAAAELREGFNDIKIETWIVVIPQIIARIHVRDAHFQELLINLLKRIGQTHPQALLYPILVATYAINGNPTTEQLEPLKLMKVSYPTLVNEGELIGRRFVDIAVFWDEKWHESLEEASKYYFNENDVKHMLEILLPLHRDLASAQGNTNSERRFIANYAEQLNQAYSLLRTYQDSEDGTLIQQAWDIYYSVFRKIDRGIRDMDVLHLSDAAPDLLNKDFIVAIPGTYSPLEREQVCIDKIVPEIQVLSTKQRPRKLTIEGNDGSSYTFLLKGHEDLRQDERVMQLFGLVNTILASDFEASEREMSIARYAVTPLSPNVGLIGWVPNCDTLHALIKEYREVKGIAINIEHQKMKDMAPNCENLTVIQKVEVFREALAYTDGDDLKNIMWMKSSNSEHWLAHRSNYIRSCAVMSIVGYFLGLGDRHPSNLMIDRYTGKLVHIDFGDCFEAGMNREKFPEKVPFRLTRMMVKAMEVAGLEGTFRKTCELVMHVLRDEKEILMAMLEAFIHDPLINWRLACLRKNQEEENLGDTNEILNDRAIQAMRRIQLKLSGRENDPNRPSLTVEEQVDYLIKEATSDINLCQGYIGWCPFW